MPDAHVMRWEWDQAGRCPAGETKGLPDWLGVEQREQSESRSI